MNCVKEDTNKLTSSMDNVSSQLYCSWLPARRLELGIEGYSKKLCGSGLHSHFAFRRQWIHNCNRLNIVRIFWKSVLLTVTVAAY